jgi:hypothetical protein
MNCSQKKIAHSSKEITMAQMKKPASKKVSNGSDTKPYNVQLTKPKDIIEKKPVAKKPASKTLTGPAAVKALQDRVSQSGVRQAEADAKKAIAKKYPGLTKKK